MCVIEPWTNDQLILYIVHRHHAYALAQINIQLTPEQCRLELHGSTSFSVVNTAVLRDPRLVEPKDTESLPYMEDQLYAQCLHGESSPLTPVVQGSTFLFVIIQFIKSLNKISNKSATMCHVQTCTLFFLKPIEQSCPKSPSRSF